MVHAADDLRGHVTGGSTGLFGVAFFLLPSHSEISDTQVPILLKHQVFGFEVAVDDAFGVDVLQSQDDASSDKLCIEWELTGLFFIEELVKTEMVAKVSTP